MSTNIYCGNNRLNRFLIDNSKTLGTRYKCLKIGIQKGKSLPIDNDYTGPYDPIDDTKIYCGNSNRLKNEYDRFGNLAECLQKGIGIGKKIKANENNNDSGDSIDDDNFVFVFNYKNILLFLILEIVLFLFLFISKPKFLLKKYSNVKTKNKKKIDIFKFILIYVLISCIIFFLIFITLKTLI
jgi:hypothetical protein